MKTPNATPFAHYRRVDVDHATLCTHPPPDYFLAAYEDQEGSLCPDCEIVMASVVGLESER